MTVVKPSKVIANDNP